MFLANYVRFNTRCSAGGFVSEILTLQTAYAYFSKQSIFLNLWSLQLVSKSELVYYS